MHTAAELTQLIRDVSDRSTQSAAAAKARIDESWNSMTRDTELKALTEQALVVSLHSLARSGR